MPMSFLDGALSRVLDGVETKSFVKAFKKAARAGGKVGGGIVIDTRGRKWNSSLHPRDSRGRFIETGGIAKVWGGGRGRVIRSLGNGKVELRMADGSKRVVPARRLTMVSRPNGGRPIKDDGSRKSRALVMAEDVTRQKHAKRGDGVKTPDENDRDGDGIPNHLDHTPDGFIDGDKPDWADDGRDDDLADAPHYQGRRPQARPKVIRDEFKTVAEVKAHWKGEDRKADDPDAPTNPEAAALADKLESAQLSDEGEHLVARVDGQWMVFQSDTGKPVAGHNGSRRLIDKPSALLKANELDDVYDPEANRRTAGGKGPKIPRGHRDAGGTYTIKDVKPAGGDLKQVELYDGKGTLVATTTSRIDSKPGQAAGWRGEAHGIDIKAGNEADFVARAKQIDQAVKAERDPGAIDRVADHFWKVSVDGNGGDEKKAARAVRAFVSQKRANGKGSQTTPMGRRDEKINKALELRAAAAEKGQPVPTAAARKVDAPAAAPAQAVPAAPAPVDAPNAPQAPQQPRTAAPDAPNAPTVDVQAMDAPSKPGPDASKHGVDPTWKDAMDRIESTDGLIDARDRNLKAAADARGSDVDMHMRRVDHLDDVLAERGVKTEKRAPEKDAPNVDAPEGRDSRPIEFRKEKDARGGDAAKSSADELERNNATVDTHRGDDRPEVRDAVARYDEVSDSNRLGKRKAARDVAAAAKKDEDRKGSTTPKGEDTPKADPKKGTPQAAPAKTDGSEQADAPARDRLDALDADHPDDPAIKKHTDAARQARQDGDSDKAEHHTGIAEALSSARKKKAEKDAEATTAKNSDAPADKDRADAPSEPAADLERADDAPTADAPKDKDADAPKADEQDPNPTPAATLDATPESAEGTEKNGDAGDSTPVREDRPELLGDVPAEQGRADEGPDGVLSGPRRAGDESGQSGTGRRPAGGKPDGDVDVPRREGGARSGQEGSRGDGAARPGVPDAGARDGDAPRAADADARVGGRGGRGGTRKPAGGSDGVDRASQPKKAAGKPRRFKPKGQEDLARPGERNKVTDNLAALRLLRQLNDEDRQATPEEQKVLARWAGWGALPDVFEDGKASSYVNDAERAELKELLSADEYREARANTKNAHYTDAAVVMSMWAAMKDLGFSDGDVLEPGSGSGNFMGFAPDGARMTGVELDPITAGISRHLYPDAEVHNESFGDSPFREGAFDAVIGNVPFGNFPVYDKTYNKGNKHSIHDHFIIKSLASVKPGGVATIVTSSYTMDKQSPESRKAIAKYGDLLGAVRLPAGAHKSAAGTDVVTDVLVFRRRKDTDAPADMSWLNASPAVHANGNPVFGIKPKDGDPKQLHINDYFRDNPDKVLGNIVDGGYNGIAVKADGDTDTKLKAALADVTKKANGADRGFNVGADAPKVAKRNVGSDRDGRIAYVGEDEVGTGKGAKDRGHKFEVMEDGERVALNVPKTQQEELRDLLSIRDAADELIDAETKFDDSNPTVAAARKRLNRLYDEYVAKNGAITRFDLNEKTTPDGETSVTRKAPPVMRYALDDEGAASLFGLEHGYDPGTKKAKKADIFHERQIDRDRAIPEKAETPEDALALAAERGDSIDSASLGKLLGMPPEHVEDLLVGNGLAFRDHEGSGQLIPADHYKAGNIRKKLEAARAAAESDPKLRKNVEALESVMPADATLEEVPKQLGAPWMGTDVVREFARSLMGTDVAVDYSPEEGWKAPTPTRGRIKANEAEWGTPDRSFYQLLESALKQQHKVITVTRRNEDGTTWVDKKASELATAAAANIEAAWEDFIWSNADVGDRIASRYNQKFRSIVPRVADTRKRHYPGMAVGKDLRPHQNGGVNRIVSDEAVLLEHVVGSGKTFTLAAGAMELRRLGLANKVALTVPNPLLAQWVSEFKELYPNAKILTVDSDAIGKGPAARKRFAAKVRNNDWDVVLFTGESFESIPVSEQAFRSYMDKEVDLLRRRLDKAKAGGKKTTVKAVEKQISALEAKIEESVKKRYDEDGITFEDLGIDYVMVDEAHRYKNLPFSTGIQGVNPPQGADRARDMHMKLGLLRDLSEERGGPKRVATFATGTPISNSLAEMYTMERFLRPDLLEEAGIEDFDAWAATFANIVKKTESDNSSTGYVERVRFRGFTDAVGDGLRLWRSFSDTVTGKQLEEAGYIKVPKLHGGARKIHVVERTEDQSRARNSFKARIDAMAGRGRAKKGDDTHVAVINDGRAMAIDPRLMSERGRKAAGIDRDDPNIDSPKLDSAASAIVDIWKREKDREFKVNHDDPDDAPKAVERGALQMAFIDSSAPKKDQFNAYTALKDRLVAQGMDPKRIRFVQETAGNPEAKARLMEDARQGRVDLIIGSTEALGTGTNAQNRLVALHHIEASWKPSDIEQREGRALRQGNQYGEVEIHAYITKGTHDEKTWDMIAYKQAGLDELQNGDYNTRAIEFADDVDPLKDFDTLAGEAAEDALAIDMREIQSDLKGLEAAKRQYDRSQARARSIVDTGRRDAHAQELSIQRLDKAINDRVDTTGDKFRMGVRNSDWRTTFGEVDTREAAADMLKARLAPMLEGYVVPGEGHKGYIAQLGGFNVRAMTINESGRKPHIALELMPTDAYGEYGPSLPLQPVVVSREDLGGNMRGVIQRLENRLSGMDDRRDQFKKWREQNLVEIGAATEQIGKPFRQADELDSARERMRLVSTLLTPESAKNDQGEQLPKAALDDMRKTYDRLKDEAAARSVTGKRRKQPAAGVAVDPNAPVAPPKMAESAPRPPKAEKPSKPKAAAPKQDSITLDPAEVAKDAEDLATPDVAGPTVPDAAAPKVDAPSADVPEVAKPDADTVSLDPAEVAKDADALSTPDVEGPKVPDVTPADTKPDATPDNGIDLVESVNEGQLPGQTRIGGEDVRSEIGEDFLQQQDMTPKAPKEPVDEPAKQDGPSLFDEPDDADVAAPAASTATPQGDAPADTAPGRPAADATPDVDAAAAPEAPKGPDAPEAPAAPAAPKAKKPRKPKQAAAELEPTPEDPFGIERHVGEWKPDAVAASKWGALGPLWSKLGKDSPEAQAVWIASKAAFGGDPTAKGAEHFKERGDVPEVIDAVERLSEHMRGTHGDSDLADRMEKWLEGYRAARDGQTPSTDAPKVDAPKTAADYKAEMDAADAAEKAKWNRPDPATTKAGDLKPGDVIDITGGAPGGWLVQKIEDNGDGRLLISAHPADWPSASIDGKTNRQFILHPDDLADGSARTAGKNVDAPSTDAPAAPEAPKAPAAPKGSKKPLKRDEVTFHEQYGDVSRGELAAIKKHNVSPSDHDALVEHYGEDHEAIRQAILDPENHSGRSFSEYKWRQRRGDAPAAASDGGSDGGDKTPDAPSTPDEPGDDAPSTPDTLPDGRAIPEGKRVVKDIPAGQLVPGDELTNGFKVTGRPARGVKTPGNKVIVRGNYPGRPEKDYEWNRSTYFNVLRDAKPESEPVRGTAPSMVGKKKVIDENGRTKHVLVRDDGKEVDVPESVWDRSDAPDTTDPVEVHTDAPTSDDLPDTTDERVPDPVEVGTPTAAETPAPAAPVSEKEKYVRGRIAGEKYDPNPQQGDIYKSTVVDGKDVIVEAKAGAGKTSTLEGLARRIAEMHPDAKILYAAFNKSVQLEAEGRMPSNVETRTGHSLAWNYVGRGLTDKFGKSGQLSNAKDVARHLGITEDLGDYEPEDLARAVQKALGQYVLSADDVVSAKHFNGISLKPDEMKKLVGFAEKAWEDYKSPSGRLRVSQDDFRKMWALSRPDFTKSGSGTKRRATILFVDEAQDTPPVLAKVFADQKMQKVIVGDPDQAIYGFAGATDYLSKAQGDVRLPLDKSYRYGPQIADAGNRFLQLLKSKARAIGGGPESTITKDMKDADAVLVRSNGGLLGAIEEELGRGRTVGVPKGTKTELMSLIESAGYLRGERGKPWKGMHPDLEPFNTWAEVKKAAEKGDDPKIAMVARLVDRYGVDGMEDLVSQVTEPADDALAGVQIDRDDTRLSLGGNTWALNEAVKKANDGLGLTSLGFRFRKNESGKGGTWEFAGNRDAQEGPLAKVRSILGAGEQEKPDVTISTAHKAKGLEWDRVRIGDDFPQPKIDEETGAPTFPNDEELRLDYVAVTRAAKELDPGSLDWVYEHTDENGDAKKAKVDAPSAPESAPKADAPSAPQSAPESAPKAPESAPAPSAPAAPDVDTTPDVDVTPDGPRPVKDMSTEDLQSELDSLDPQSNEARWIDVFTELDGRDMGGSGSGLGQRGQGKVKVGDVRGEVHDDNARIVDRGWDDSQGGMAPSEGLHFLPERYRKTLLDGGKVPANVIGKYVPEETTMHVWGMTPDEMRKHGFTHYGIPGAVKLSDRLGEKSGTKIDDPKGVLSRDVADLHDDELDEAVDLVKRAGDDEHLEWLGMEQARRAQLSDEDRKREDAERRDRRDADDEGDDAFDDEGDGQDEADTPAADADAPAKPKDDEGDGFTPLDGRGKRFDDDESGHPVVDKTDRELDEHNDKDEAKKERDRRDALSEDERKKDDDERNRRRRNRRRRRRNRRGGHGGRGGRMPHLNRPRMNMPSPSNDNGSPAAGARPGKGSANKPAVGDGSTLPGVPNIDARDPKKVEDTLAEVDKDDPIREDGTLTPASHKDGVDMTPDERAAENDAIDEAYGDHAPTMEREAAVDMGVKPDYLPQEQWDDLQSHAAPLRDSGLPIKAWRSGNEYGRPWAAFDVNDAVTGDHLGVSVSTNDKGDGFKVMGTLVASDSGATTVRGKDLAKVLDRFAKSPAERERLGMGPIAATSELVPDGNEGTPAIVGRAKMTPNGKFVENGKLVRAKDLQPGDVIGIGDRNLGEVLAVDEVPYPGRGPKQVVVSLKPSEFESGKPATIRTSPMQNWGVYDEWEPADAVPAVDVTPEAAPDVTPDVTPEAPAGLPRLDDLVVTPEAPASVPNTPAATESAPSTPGVSTPEPEVANPFTGRRLPNGLTPEQARAVLTPGPDGQVTPVAVVTEDGQLHIGTPVANRFGGLRGIEVAPGVVNEFDAADVRTIRPVNVTPEVAPSAPEAPAVRPDVTPSTPVDEYGPAADTPIPDGLSVPAESLPDAFAPSDRPEATVSTPDRPRPLTPSPAKPRSERGEGQNRTENGTDSTPDAGTAETVVDPEGSNGPIEAKPARRERPGWAKRAREAAQKRADRRRAKDQAAVDSFERELEDTPQSVDDAPKPEQVDDAAGQIAAYVSPVTLQIGDYARVEGYDVNGAKASTAGFLMNDPQPVLADLGDGEVDMLAVTVSDEYDGLGLTRTVYVPLDSMASLAPRPNMDDVPDEGWLMDDNRLKVRDNRMPDRIPTDRNGMGLFPGSIIADRKRSGRVIQSRGQDVTVMWDDSDQQESRAGATLNVVDGGAARPDGWSVDGRRVKQLGKPGANGRRNGSGRRGGQRSDGRTVSEREAASESEALANDLFDRIEKATRRIQRGNLSRRQQEALIRQLAREAVEASTRRRADAARRIAAAYPHRPGLLAQIATWLQRLATAVVEALVVFWLAARDGFRDGETGIVSNTRRKESVQHAIDTAAASRAKRGLDRLLEDEEAA